MSSADFGEHLPAAQRSIHLFGPQDVFIGFQKTPHWRALRTPLVTIHSYKDFRNVKHVFLTFPSVAEASEALLNLKTYRNKKIVFEKVIHAKKVIPQFVHLIASTPTFGVADAAPVLAEDEDAADEPDMPNIPLSITPLSDPSSVTGDAEAPPSPVMSQSQLPTSSVKESGVGEDPKRTISSIGASTPSSAVEPIPELRATKTDDNIPGVPTDRRVYPGTPPAMPAVDAQDARDSTAPTLTVTHRTAPDTEINTGVTVSESPPSQQASSEPTRIMTLPANSKASRALLNIKYPPLPLRAPPSAYFVPLLPQDTENAEPQSTLFETTAPASHPLLLPPATNMPDRTDTSQVGNELMDSYERPEPVNPNDHSIITATRLPYASHDSDLTPNIPSSAEATDSWATASMPSRIIANLDYTEASNWRAPHQIRMNETGIFDPIDLHAVWNDRPAFSQITQHHAARPAPVQPFGSAPSAIVDRRPSYESEQPHLTIDTRYVQGAPLRQPSIHQSYPPRIPQLSVPQDLHRLPVPQPPAAPLPTLNVAHRLAQVWQHHSPEGLRHAHRVIGAWQAKAVELQMEGDVHRVLREQERAVSLAFMAASAPAKDEAGTIPNS